MTRRYYADPLAAAWMAKHFGMKLYCRHDDAEMAEHELAEGDREFPFSRAAIDDGCTAETWGAVIHESLGRRAYIHTDSLHLLEPRSGDLAMTTTGTVALIESGLENRRIGTQTYRGFLFGGFFEEAARIRRVLERDGKPFFWPEPESGAA